jgi:hypothetical protein
MAEADGSRAAVSSFLLEREDGVLLINNVAIGQENWPTCVAMTAAISKAAAFVVAQEP